MDNRLLKEIPLKMSEIQKNVGQVIVGKDKIVRLLTIAFICEGHVLLEDVPGLGKTRIVKTFAKTVGESYQRIQFTPDLLPSDLTGIQFYNQKTQDFQFRKGPLFGNIILADEINRATPRTQSSLLEAMDEKQITIDGETFKLEKPYMVMATQNPIETQGTFPLPEAQLDRFFMRLSIGYPSRDEEISIIEKNLGKDPLETVTQVMTYEESQQIAIESEKVKVSKEVQDYLLNIIQETRNSSYLSYGASPRGTISLYKASQVNALLEGRSFVIPEDVKEMARYVLNHRIALKNAIKRMSLFDGIDRILSEIETPVELAQGE